MRMVTCIKLGKELPGLDYPPMGGPLGVRLWQHASADAWKLFIEQFKMIMNEEHLQGGTPEATRKFMEAAEKFFFGDGALEKPPDFVETKHAH